MDATTRSRLGYLNDMFGLAGTVAVVSGGTSGLGAAVATGLAAAGAHVVVVGRDEERGEAVVATATEGGGSAEFRRVDVRRPEEIARVAAQVLSAHDAVDILINAAGISPTSPALDITLDEWESVFDINVRATFLMCQAFGRAMITRGSGKIVNFASTDALVGVPELVTYAASKGAVVQITRSLAAEWIKHGVNVNCVAPTEFATPMTQPLMNDPAYHSWVETAIPIGRVGQPPELVGAVLFLVAPSSSMVVGHTLLVDGGRTIV
jgi:NAD(P)-dependent dehydrogenase (short-subunit alcohol dehydrogenase family)